MEEYIAIHVCNASDKQPLCEGEFIGLPQRTAQYDLPPPLLIKMGVVGIYINEPVPKSMIFKELGL